MIATQQNNYPAQQLVWPIVSGDGWKYPITAASFENALLRVLDGDEFAQVEESPFNVWRPKH